MRGLEGQATDRWELNVSLTLVFCLVGLLALYPISLLKGRYPPPPRRYDENTLPHILQCSHLSVRII